MAKIETQPGDLAVEFDLGGSGTAADLADTGETHLDKAWVHAHIGNVVVVSGQASEVLVPSGKDYWTPLITTKSGGEHIHDLDEDAYVILAAPEETDRSTGPEVLVVKFTGLVLHGLKKCLQYRVPLASLRVSQITGLNVKSKEVNRCTTLATASKRRKSST